MAVIERIIKIWMDGGWVMIPLAIVALLLYTNAFELLLFVLKGRLGLKRSDSEAKAMILNPQIAKGPIREIIEFACSPSLTAKQIRNRFEQIRLERVTAIERRIAYVSMLVAVSPLMGLLGTVIGMSMTFIGIAQSASSQTAEAVADGVSAALITTQAGLIIALPGLFLVMIIKRLKHSLEADLVHLECLSLTQFKAE
jgi:biopolymer transport protein ExbB